MAHCLKGSNGIGAVSAWGRGHMFCARIPPWPIPAREVTDREYSHERLHQALATRRQRQCITARRSKRSITYSGLILVLTMAYTAISYLHLLEANLQLRRQDPYVGFAKQGLVIAWDHVDL